MGTIQGPYVEVLGITLGVLYRSKPGVDEVSEMVLSGVSVDINWVGNI